MRQLPIVLVILVTPFFSIAQPKLALRKTFYGLPLNSFREKIKKQLMSDSCFLEKPNDDSSIFEHYSYTYFGNIIRHNLPNSYQIDSATIELTYGYGAFTSKSKARNLTIIKLKYYVPDIHTSNTLAQELWNNLKGTSLDTSQVTIGRKEDNNFSYGRQIKLHRKKYLPQLSVLQQEINDAIFIVQIEYERFGD